MSASVTVPFWPATLDCVRWSQDNLIAVAGSESIAILVPRLRARAVDEATWDVEVLKVNAFTIKEMPLMEPLSFSNWSLGQEISQRYVQSMAWSDPGLGRFDTSALAILHSDYTLAVWTYQGRPGVKENWYRCLTVTRAIHDHYRQEGSRSEALSVHARARAMTWAPASCGSFSRRGQQCLAVATEAGDILLVEITSPFDMLEGDKPNWTAVVRHSISCSSYLPALDRALHSRTTMGDDYTVIEALTWSYDTQSHHHQFIFLAKSCIYEVRWQPPTEDTKPTSFKALTEPHNKVEAPLRLSSDGETVLYIVDDAVVARPLSHSSAYARLLPRRWSDVAGLAVTATFHGLTRVYPALHMNYHSQQAEPMTFPAEPSDHRPSTGIITALLDDMKVYSRKLELGGGVKTYAWGIDGSPSGLEVACCCSMLPADSAAHIISSEQTSTVYVGPTAQLDADEVAAEYDTTESILFAIQMRFNPLDIEADDYFEAAARVAINRYVAALPSHNVSYHSRDIPEDCRKLAETVLLHAERLNDLQGRLLAIALSRTYRTSMPPAWYLALIQCYNEIFVASHRAGKFSQRIMSMYSNVRSRLSQDSAIPTDEQCGICDEKMSFEALRWARCPSGHRFTRCALTFLAITQPGTNKSCGACGVQYLHEQHVPELGPVNEPAAASNVESSCSPARILFAAVRRCILCHGRFVS